MGSGGQKAHEAIAIAPSSTPPAPTVITVDGAGINNAGVDVANLTVSTEIHSEAFAEEAPDTAGGPDNEEPPAVPRADIQDEELLDGDDFITPVPEDLVVGDMAGHPLIVGGDDFDDSSLTLVSYADVNGNEPREVLYGWVNPDAEHKILDALALDEEKLVPVEVTKDINGRIPLDEQHKLYEQMETVAKSVNHHLKLGDGIPAHTHTNFEKLHDQLGELHDDATDDEKAMLASYLEAVDNIAPKLVDGYDEAYTTGGKIGHIDAWTVAQTVTVTEMVPVPAEDVPDGLLPAKIRNTTRIKPALDDAGAGSWDGTSRYSSQGGKEYRVDLGDGYEAVYRPTTTSSGDAANVGQRGFLEVVAPPGAGHGPEMVERLEQLNLVNRPMTRSEAEWTYLQRNIWAQHLDQHTEVANAMTAAKTLDDTVTELVFSEKAHQAIGMNDTQLAGFAKKIQLESEARALPEKTRMVRNAVAKHLGHPDGVSLAASAGYDPTPRRTAGWYSWDRFDVTAAPDAVGAKFNDRVLYHRVTGNNVADMFRNSGALVATERRRVMGVKPGLGMSESADMTSGGSRVVDLRVGTAPTNGPVMIWKQPTRLLRRVDWYAYDGDHFAASSNEKNWSTSGQTRDPAKVAKFKKSNNEILFRNGIDLTGPEAPDQIKCNSASQRSEVINVLSAKGITHLGDTPIEKVVTT